MFSCRHCGAALQHGIVDLGHQPPSNAYLPAPALCGPEVAYPLKVFVCTGCWLVQLPEHAAADQLFTPDYAYFSSTSKAWLAHSERYVAAMVDHFGLDEKSFAIEVASNDGYLLQFVKARGIPCLGIEPTAATAAAARAKGIETVELFLGEKTASELVERFGKADLVTANNVLAHVPDINDFVRGVATLLATFGVVTFEFPHLLSLLEGVQFDTIYHEHYSYLSLSVVTRILAPAGLVVFDIEELTTHGGSLRVFVCHADAGRETAPAVAEFIERERTGKLDAIAGYADLQRQAEHVKDELLSFLLNEKRQGRTVAAYGAAAKGNTLLNYAGVHGDLLAFVCDAAPSKQGLFLPGSHIPILAPEALMEHRPDTVLILPWNIADEIVASLPQVRAWGGKFATAVPRLAIR